jgi:hypothetical protein
VRKTQEYLSIFARFRDEDTVSAVEHILKTPENAGLHPFEIAQLGTLELVFLSIRGSLWDFRIFDTNQLQDLYLARMRRKPRH